MLDRNLGIKKSFSTDLRISTEGVTGKKRCDLKKCYNRRSAHWRKIVKTKGLNLCCTWSA